MIDISTGNNIGKEIFFSVTMTYCRTVLISPKSENIKLDISKYENESGLKGNTVKRKYAIRNNINEKYDKKTNWSVLKYFRYMYIIDTNAPKAICIIIKHYSNNCILR
jgi:hypothetical protein